MTIGMVSRRGSRDRATQPAYGFTSSILRRAKSSHDQTDAQLAPGNIHLTSTSSQTILDRTIVQSRDRMTVQQQYDGIMGEDMKRQRFRRNLQNLLDTRSLPNSNKLQSLTYLARGRDMLYRREALVCMSTRQLATGVL